MIIFFPTPGLVPKIPGVTKCSAGSFWVGFVHWTNLVVSNICVILLFAHIYGFVMNYIIETRLAFFVFLLVKTRAHGKYSYSHPVCRSYTHDHNQCDQPEREISL